MLDLWFGVIDLKKLKSFKKELNKELVPVAWHPTRWWNCQKIKKE